MRGSRAKFTTGPSSLPVAACLAAGGLREQILYIVTTLGLPLRVDGSGTSEMNTTTFAVDSEYVGRRNRYPRRGTHVEMARAVFRSTPASVRQLIEPTPTQDHWHTLFRPRLASKQAS